MTLKAIARRLVAATILVLLVLWFAGPTSSIASENAANLLEEGIRMYNGLEYAKAIVVLSEVAEHPEATADQKVSAYFYLGAIAVVQEREPEALSAFKKALDLDIRARMDPTRFPPHIRAVFDRAFEQFKDDLKARDTQSPRIEHEQFVEKAPYGVELPVAAKVTDDTGVESVQVNYRRKGEPAFGAATLEPIGEDRYQGVIPAASTETEAVEYYIMATDLAGKISTQGTASNPLTVEVLPKLEERSKAAALLRSLVVPGLGQIYNGQKVKGYIIMGSEAALIGTSVYFYVQGMNYQSSYEEDRPGTVDDFDRAEQAYQTSDIFAYLAIGLWIYNVVDAWIFGPSFEQQSAGGGPRNVGLAPLIVPGCDSDPCLGVGLVIRQ